MNKNELIEEIAAAAELTKKDAELALNGCLDAISGALIDGDSVAITGFGSFSTAQRTARTGRNPQTGQEIKIAAKKVVKFKAGKKLADEVA